MSWRASTVAARHKRDAADCCLGWNAPGLAIEHLVTFLQETGCAMPSIALSAQSNDLVCKCLMENLL